MKEEGEDKQILSERGRFVCGCVCVSTYAYVTFFTLGPSIEMLSLLLFRGLA